MVFSFEDNVFLGAMSEVVEGVIVGEGSVISMGMYIGQSTKIVNRHTGDITYGKIPPYSVVVPGSLPDKKNPNAPSLNCAVEAPSPKPGVVNPIPLSLCWAT